MNYYHDYELRGFIPEHIRNGFENYLIHGIAPGSFVTSVLANDLMGAVCRADATNISKLSEISTWIMRNMPYGSYGSYDIVSSWCSDCDAIRSSYVKNIKEHKFWKELGQQY